MSNPEPKETSPKPALVAIIAIAVLAILTVAGVYLVMGPLPDGAQRPALTDVLAIIGAVVAPIVSIAAAYYGVTIALKANSESQRIIRDATRASLETADGFTTAVTNITMDLHNQNLQLIEALQRGGAFDPASGGRGSSVPRAYEATNTGSTSTGATTPAPRRASDHANVEHAEVVEATEE